MKFFHMCVLIFVLFLSVIVRAEEKTADTSTVFPDVTSHQSTLPTLNAAGDVTDVIITPVIQEDFSAVPSIVSDSLQLYREQGAEAFIKSILKGSPLEGDEGSAKELERMRVVERYYGKMQKHNFFNTLKITPYFKRIYIILQFDKGPVFCSIDCYYTSKNGWVIPAFAFNTDIVKVFPDILLKQYLENSK